MGTLQWVRTAGEIVLVMAVVYAGVSYMNEREKFARWEALADQREQAIDALQERNDSLEAVKQRVDSAAYLDSLRLAEAQERLRAEREQAERETEAALTDADSTAAALDSTLTRLRERAAEEAPNLTPVVDTARAQLAAHVAHDRSVVDGFREQLATQVELTLKSDSIAQANWRRWQAAEAAYRGVRDELAAQREQTAFWKKKAEPSFLASLGSDAPKILAAFGAGAGVYAAFF